MPRTSKHDQRGGIIKCHKNVEKVQITENVDHIGCNWWVHTKGVNIVSWNLGKMPTDEDQTDKCPNLRWGDSL